MSRLFLPPLVIAGVVLLTGCSNEGTTMSCEDANAEQVRLSELLKTSLLTAAEEDKLDDDNDVNVLKANSFWNNRRVLVATNSQCFTPSQVEDWTKGWGE